MDDAAHLPRTVDRGELDVLARLWFDGWHEAHAALVPDALRRARTLDSFRTRLDAGLAGARTIGAPGAPFGLAMTRENELNQLFVHAAARGRGIAGLLARDALRRIRADGHRRAWLICMIGNGRAARFYEREGWTRRGTMPLEVVTADGPAMLDAWRYEIEP